MQLREKYLSKFGKILTGVLLISFVAGGVVSAQGPYQRFDNILTKKILVTNTATFRGDITLSGSDTDLTVSDDLAVTDDLTVGGTATFGTDGTGEDVIFYSETAGDYAYYDASAEAMVIIGTDSQDALDITDGDLDVDDNTALGDAANDTVTVTGDVTLNGVPDTDANNYNYWFKITGDMTGTTTKDRNYGLYIEMTRPAGQEVASGDFDEAGMKIRVDTEAVTTTTGTVLRGMDVEAKADNPSGTVTNLFGGAITAKSDTSAGDVGTMIALQTNAQANAQVTGEMGSADFRLFRQSATHPTEEYVINVRNSSTTGTGADAGIRIESDYGSSSTTDSMDYGIDMSAAQINTADLRLENGETISNGTDTAIKIGGFIAVDVGATLDLGAGFTITPTATYQPITNSTGGSVTSDTSTAIANGATAGALLVVCNEDAQDMVLKDGANTVFSGDLTLTGGANDCITLLWNGSDWIALAFSDN